MDGREGVSILVTMCGKSVDMIWLCERGFSVTGVELTEKAVKEFFEDNSIPYTVKGRIILHATTVHARACATLCKY